MQALTDFSDEAVALPLALLVALAALAAGRPRAAWAFALGLVALDAAVAGSKIVLGQCAPGELASPSGHAAMAAYVWGGGFGMLLGFSRARVVAVSAALAGAIGVTRVALAQHTIPEVLAGGGLGIAAAAWMAGRVGPWRPVPLGAALLLVVPLLLHGQHLRAEPVLQRLGADFLLVCEAAQ